ncbi:MAG: type II toxin-antitoxin system VapC family toxin [Anaerolineae bacterium]
MSGQAVIDSNVLVALIDSRDKWHERALALHAALKAKGVSLVYFDCVLNETISVMARRAEEQKRSAEFSRLMDELLRRVPEDVVIWVSAETQRRYGDIVGLVRKFEGALNFHDALIALSCRELGIPAIISFDEDLDPIAWLVRIATPEDVRQKFA